MTTIELEIDPIPKGRPRFSRSGHAYTPSRTRTYENALKVLLAQKIDFLPFKGGVDLEMRFAIKKPRSTRYGQFPPGDLDNLIKALTDAGNGILYNDDKQVVKIVASKVWDVKGKITIIIYPMESL